MSKKKYVLPPEISTEISNTVELVENNIGTLNYKIVPLNAIEFDPNNPRELAITREDLPNGPKVDDPLYSKKLEEFESLKCIAETIKKYGVRKDVEIYKNGTSYCLIHGERRCLSSILAGKKDIPAKVLDEKPNNFDIRLLQLIENVQREDLTLHETTNNIRQVLNEYKNHVDPEAIIDAPFLESLINRSKTHCINFLAVLNSPPELQTAIKKGDIKSLEKAAIIAKARTQIQREALMRACLDGLSLKQLKQKATQQKNLGSLFPSLVSTGKKRPGKQASKINLGATKSRAVIAKFIQLVSIDPLYTELKEQLNQLPLDDFGSCSHAFVTLIQIMEKVEKN